MSWPNLRIKQLRKVSKRNDQSWPLCLYIYQSGPFRNSWMQPATFLRIPVRKITKVDEYSREAKVSVVFFWGALSFGPSAILEFLLFDHIHQDGPIWSDHPLLNPRSPSLFAWLLPANSKLPILVLYLQHVSIQIYRLLSRSNKNMVFVYICISILYAIHCIINIYMLYITCSLHIHGIAWATMPLMTTYPVSKHAIYMKVIPWSCTSFSSWAMKQPVSALRLQRIVHATWPHIHLPNSSLTIFLIERFLSRLKVPWTGARIQSPTGRLL